MMNVLLTSVGRRAYMVKYFKEAVGPEGEVHACNSDENTVAFFYADQAVVSPLIYDESYIPFLLQYCKDNHINLLLSLFDIDLPVLAKNKRLFEEIGTRVIVSSQEFVEICNDKWKSYQFLNSNGFFCPKTYLSIESASQALKNGELQYPVVVKPRFGCGSIAVSLANNIEELIYCFKHSQERVENSYLKFESAADENNILIQECLHGQEYGADVINDLNGLFQNAIIRKKDAMRAGETDIAIIVDNKVIYHELSRLGRITGHIANLDCDIFLVDNKPYILEMNARFGGGYPFSHIAGCNLPKAIVYWAEGKKIRSEWIQAENGVKGYKELVLTRV